MPIHMESDNKFIEEARHIAAQCWCDSETSSIEMDTRLAEAFAWRLAGWMNDAAMFARNADFYRELLDQTAAHLGSDVYVSDDGSVQDEPIRLKIPDMVAALTVKKAE